MVNVLSVKEKLTQNLAGDQIAYMLDRFILSSIKPISLQTFFLYPIISGILIQTYNDNRRKISILDKQKVVNRLFSSLLTDNPKEHWLHFKNARLERIILRNIIQEFLKQTKGYKEIHIEYIRANSEFSKALATGKLKGYESKVRCPVKYLYNVIDRIEFYLSYYLRFKHLILEKYIRLAHLESVKVKEMSNLTIDQEGLFENFVLATDKAIEKYSSEKGALTSYIKYWYMDARSNPIFNCETNQAVSTRIRTRRKLSDKDGNQLVQQTFAEDFTKYEDHLESSEEYRPDLLIEEEDTVNSLYKIINKIEGVSFAKLLYEIPYYLSEEEINLQKESLKDD